MSWTAVLAFGMACAILMGTSQRVCAYDVDVHYFWTHYLALHVGFSDRQAHQIASATFAVDHDPETAPMETATAMDAIFGADRRLSRNPQKREYAERATDLLRKRIEEQRRQGGSFRDPLRHENWWMLGVEWEDWEHNRARIRNIWSKFHAFAEAELTRQEPRTDLIPYGNPNVEPTPYTIQVAKEFLTTVKKVLSSRSLISDLHIWPDHYRRIQEAAHSAPVYKGTRYEAWKKAWDDLGQRALDDFATIWDVNAGEIKVNVPAAEAVIERNKVSLWAIGLDERNPGAYLHFLQDSFSHANFDNVRGHAVAGHWPDFLSTNTAKARSVTLATLRDLCLFRRFLIARHGVTVVGPETDLCQLLRRSPQHQERFDHPRLKRIDQALDAMISANPPPRRPFYMEPGILPEFVHHQVRGVPSKSIAGTVIAKLIVCDRNTGLLPAIRAHSLEARWGQPPPRYRDSGGRIMTDPAYDNFAPVSDPCRRPAHVQGAVWPELSIPNEWIQFDFDRKGRVVFKDLKSRSEYIGGGTVEAALKQRRSKLNDFETVFAVELPRVQPLDVGIEMRELPQNEGWSEVRIVPNYRVTGIKDFSPYIHFPLPAVVACWLDRDPLRVRSNFDDNPYSQAVRAYGGEWGGDDEWGSRIISRKLTRNGPFTEQIKFRIRSRRLAKSARAHCAIHLYGRAAVDFPPVLIKAKPGAAALQVKIGNLKQGRPQSE